MKTVHLLILSLVFALAAHAELRVPAFTAYLDPQPNGASVTEKSGVSNWHDPALKVCWFGDIQRPGEVACALALRLPAGAVSKLRLTVAGQAREVTAKGDAGNLVTVSFGSFQIARPGYQRFALASLNAPGQPAGDLDTLILDGPAAQGAHFNLQPRRNAASVHLAYAQPKDRKIAAFYCEVTAVDDPVATYYMATGWNRGYFGMQVNSATERRIIFSVWDAGREAVDRGKVAEENRTSLVAKGAGVSAGDFGHEGTGGHSHLVYAWKTGEAQRFIVTAQPVDATHTIYSGYWFHPGNKQWMLISSWKAPETGDWLHGLYSFSENFGGTTGHLRRKARYGNQWLRTDDGVWIEQTSASFSHDPTGKADRRDRFMGVEDGAFFLSHGGFVPGFTKFGETFTRPATGKPPTDFAPPTAKAIPDLK